jgi:predicted amidophosphoribosyltransferase
MVSIRQSLFRVKHHDSHQRKNNTGVNNMFQKNKIYEQEKCVECGKEIPPYRKYYCEECYEKALKEKIEEEK